MGRIVSTSTSGNYQTKTSSPGDSAATCTPNGNSVTIDNFVTANIAANSDITFYLIIARKGRVGSTATVSIMSGSTIISTGTTSLS